MKFEFASVKRIVFGRGESRRVAEIVASLGTRPLVVHNGRGAERVIDGVMVRQKGEPTVVDVDAAVEVAKREGCDVVVGYGGGSALDAAKAVAGLVTNGGSIVDYLEVVGNGRKITKPALPLVMVPVTAGTGAEATRNAVVGWPEKKFKASIRSEHLLACVAVVDPELGVGVPPGVTAASGMDALAQCIESYVSTGSSPMTDGLAIQGVKLAARWLRRAYENGKDLNAREGMAHAALISGITLTNAGLGAVHGFAAPLGANFPVPHGALCAALLPEVIGANLKAAREQGLTGVLAKYAQVGRALAGEPMMGEDAAVATCEAFAAELVRDLKIPGLKEYGVTEARVDEMVDLAKRSNSMKYNPVALPDDVLADVLREAINR